MLPFGQTQVYLPSAISEKDTTLRYVVVLGDLFSLLIGSTKEYAP